MPTAKGMIKREYFSSRIRRRAYTCKHVQSVQDFFLFFLLLLPQKHTKIT